MQSRSFLRGQNSRAMENVIRDTDIMSGETVSPIADINVWTDPAVTPCLFSR